MATKTSDDRRFKVGDRVRFTFGVTKVEGTVIEDRGSIGYGGRRLYRVRFQFEQDEEPMHVELPVVDLELASPSH